MISILSNNLPFQSNFILGHKCHMVEGQENMEVATLVGFRVWLRNVAQAETSAVVRCRRGFANPLTITFLVACSVLSHGYTTELVNNIPYLVFDPLERTHDA
jgi:hypothetical protein